MVEALERHLPQAREAIEEGVNIIDPLRPPARPAPRADPVAAGGRRRPPPPRARGHAPARRDHRRVGRAARGAPLRDADRLRRERDQPLPAARDARRAGRPKGASCAGRRRQVTALDAEEAAQNLVKAIGKGLLKTISKMGISTIQSYRGAQIFEAVGLERELIDTHFTGTASRIGGVGLTCSPTRRSSATRVPTRSARRAAAGRRRLRVAPRRRAPHVEPRDDRARPARGARGQRRRGGSLQGDGGLGDEVRTSPAFEKYREYARAVNEDAARSATLRGLLEIGAGPGARPPRSRSSRSSRRARSSSASAPAR